MIRQGHDYLNWDELPDRLSLGTHVRLPKRDNVEGWIVAFKQAQYEPICYYVSETERTFNPHGETIIVLASDVEVIR